MIDYINISSLEFRKKLKENNEICMLANVLLIKDNSFNAIDLSNTKKYIRQKFIEKAIGLIECLNGHKLYIIHMNKLSHKENYESVT